MDSTDNNSARIGKLVLRVALRNLPIDKDKEARELLRLLSTNETRNAVYDACVVMSNDDPERRKTVYHFMMVYLPGFPASREMLQKIDAMLKQNAPERSTDAKIQHDLEEVVSQQLAQRPFSHVLNSAAAYNRESADIDARSHYLDTYGLQLLACKEDKGNLCAFKSQDEDETRGEAARAKGAQALDPKTLTALPCTDYINQTPLECTRRTVEQQLDVLENLWDANPQNADVVRATLFLVKQMCDGYVAKLVFGPPYRLLRAVSTCYLPMLLTWMASDYMYVRKNVYDFLLTLSLHLQLVDTRGRYAGCTEALQNELIWLLLNVVRRQALTVPYDHMTWAAAAKCTLAVVPRCYRHLVDARALKQFLLLPDLAEKHPSTFGVLVEAFSRSLLADKRVGVRPRDNLVLDVAEFAKLGSSAVADILLLYRKSTTVLARAALFHLLFAYAADKVQAGLPDDQYSSGAVRDAFQALEQLDFPWFVYSLLLYQSSRVLGQLPDAIVIHLQNTDLYGCHAEVAAIVRILTNMVAEDAHLPSTLGGASTQDVLTAIPSLLKQETDVRLYNMAWRLAVYCARFGSAATGQRRDDSRDVVTQLARCLVAYPDASGEAERTLVRRVCPDLLGSLLALGRSHPSQSEEPLSVLLETYLFSPESRLTVPCLMTLYHHVLESLTMRRASIWANGRVDWDVSHLLERGLVVCPINALRSVGSRVLWAFYVGLRSDQSRAVCRARHVLVSLLATFGQCNSAHVWQYVRSDPFSLVALIGSEKVEALAKLAS